MRNTYWSVCTTESADCYYLVYGTEEGDIYRRFTLGRSYIIAILYKKEIISGARFGYQNSIIIIDYLDALSRLM
jgi:hypothetical protein